MINKDKVIYSIERCICHVPDACRDCAYDAGHPYNECVEMMLRDALALLKEQDKLIAEARNEGYNEAYREYCVEVPEKDQETIRYNMQGFEVNWE